MANGSLFKKTIQYISSSHSEGLSDETEKPGQLLPLETQTIIRDRYEVASELAWNLKVLEVGCGSGLGLRYLAKRANCLHAIEYSDENLSLLSGNFSGLVDISKGDAHNLPFEDNSFDLIVGLAMIYYLSLERFLEESNRVLTPHGKLFFCTSNKDVPGFCPAPYTTRYHSVPELTLALKTAGFEGEFQGAFPAPGGPLWKRRYRATLKGILKTLITVLPFGKRLWKRLRVASLGQLVSLPDCVEKMTVATHRRNLISSDRQDFTYRVIYVTAHREAHDY